MIGTARQEHDAANVITCDNYFMPLIPMYYQWNPMDIRHILDFGYHVRLPHIFSILFTSFHHSFSSGILELEMETAGASGDARGSGTFSGLA